MQQVDTDPPSLPVGTEVSAKYKGAFCEAKVSKVVRNIKVKVAYKQGLGSGIISDDLIKVIPGQLRVGATVEVRHPDRKDLVEATVTKIQDCSQYTVVFDDGDITTLRRTALCLKSGRHFNESETLDQLPLTHPEHFGNPVVGGRRGRRRGQLNDDSSEDEEESDTKEVVNEKEEHIGKVVCVETESKKKDKEKWFPGLVVAPTAQATVRIRVKDEYLVRSFKDGRYYTVPKKEATEFTRELAAKQDGQAVQAALEYMQSGGLPAHWDREALFGLSNSSSEEDGELESDSSDDEPREEKDRFVAQLYKYMDDRGTPLNKVPSIQNRDVDLYRLFRAVQKRGGYNRVTSQNQWKSIAIRLGFTPVTVSVTNLVKQAFKKFLQPYGEFHRKLGCSMLMTPRNSNRSKGRSLVRANSVASPKPTDAKDPPPSKTTTPLIASSLSSTQSVIVASVPMLIAVQSGAEESENTSESSLDTLKNKRKASVSGIKAKGSLDKYEEKTSKDDGDVPLSKIKAAASLRVEDKDREKEKEVGIKDVPAAITQPMREPSPSGSIGASKREKHQKKQPPQTDEKRGKRKKDDSILEKIDLGDFPVEIGDKLKVYYHEKKVTYEAKVIDISVQRGPPIYLVHYTGWNNRYDEWVPRERIAENLTKGSKQKGRLSGTSEKSRENPPKPPTAASLTSAGSNSSSISGASVTTKISTKRGRGRSDSLPPRSTTPSSVASNSSRTKSPATASSIKKRPTRHIQNTIRRISVNVSDVSMPTESDSDSDEPVRRPTRGSKSTPTSKSTSKGKPSVSAGNSQSDTEDDEEGDCSSINLRSGVGSASTGSLSAKGRNYDLSQIRSELKGFQGLKSPSPVCHSHAVDIKDEFTIKSENLFDLKSSNSEDGVVHNDADKTAEKHKVEPKDEIVKSSTDASSETESFGDDDSQSSGKTTTLENMTKKFQQKINADKQRAMEKLSYGKSQLERIPLVVEKILQDSLAEKLQESLKAKPQLKQDENMKNLSETIMRKNESDLKDDTKKLTTQANEVKINLIAPARFGSPSVVTTCPTVVEKSICSAKKTDPTGNRKLDVSKKITDSLVVQQKKFVEPAVKEVNKSENLTSCSPSSSSSSSSSISNSSRSLPDMSKLEISGNSSTSSYSKENNESKLVGTVVKPISPDIYEFKDPEPFEFEIRKPPAINTNTSSINISLPSATNTLLTSRKLGQKVSVQQSSLGDYQTNIQNPMATLMNRKKRGSPMKEAVAEKIIKQIKIEEKIPSSGTEITKTVQSSVAVVPPTTSLTKNASVNLSPSTSTIIVAPVQNFGVITDAPIQISFDTPRKSPNFNVNMNALDEELAQTVQAFQAPHVPTSHETTPTKAGSSKMGQINDNSSPKPSTPEIAANKSSAGSPFVETKKDISNVFELSSVEGSSLTSESKDNKFELENVKILLSATVGAFDLDPAKYENKPSSIADKVLKAISQRKEEDKQKCENKVAVEKDKTEQLNDVKETPATSKTISEKTNSTAHDDMFAGSFSNEPLIIHTDLPATSTSILNSSNMSLEKFSLSALSKRTPITSPEPKIGILESITVKNDELSETIQKLECAIQRKTPVATQSVTTTPTPSLPPNTFSEDSMDSTDSERRLVIEDVADGQDEVQKTPIGVQPANDGKTLTIGIPLKIDTTTTKKISGNLLPHTSVQTPIPVKIVMPSVCASAATIQTVNLASKAPDSEILGIAPNTTNISPVDHTVQQESDKNSHLVHTEMYESTQALAVIDKESERLLKGPNDNNTEEGVECISNVISIVTLPQNTISAPSPTILRQQTQRITNVVPIVVPDIPVSVVVAPTAVPSVMAAAQAAAAAEAATPLHSSKSKTLKQSQQISITDKNAGTPKLLPVNSMDPLGGKVSLLPSKSVDPNILMQNVTSKAMAMTAASTILAIAGTEFTHSSSSSSFYLDSQAHLRPDDGVKPILDTPSQTISKECISKANSTMDEQSEELISNLSADVHNDSINLLCEETIPGSPAPLFSSKDDAMSSHSRGGGLENETTTTGNMSECADTSIVHGTVNSSPNDSASQDESSEDIKKNMDIESEISPRKQRRTRKQSEIGGLIDQQSKRRRQMPCPKKNTAGSDSEDNSDTVSQRSLPARQQFHQHVQLQEQQSTSGIRPCPYNFLVKLDSSLSPDQCIAILLKQIQELRKTYNTIKGDLASIDRRRKKLRRREREKKQLQNQQHIKIG